ncbi:unnamed protein product [Lepeophtheirus salmonis]|uniref:(salmon louse) hypothetical protein n=1 Tax=Lepeophtheirus salmonis TaxID=72036 RepID=A0A7R8CIU3_LEPSM|nr:unnamed protein product [Lepeophtheirus salmonis]CAF2832103.1 unnamed protein product [Lepeophtheirus salmonis]
MALDFLNSVSAIKKLRNALFHAESQGEQAKNLLLCFEKDLIHPIPYDLKKIVAEKVYYDFNNDEGFLPCTLCNNCYTASRSQNYDKPRKLPEKFKNKRGRPMKKAPSLPDYNACGTCDCEKRRGIRHQYSYVKKRQNAADKYLIDPLPCNKAFKWAFENEIVWEGYHGGRLNGSNGVLLLSKLDTHEQTVSKDLFGHIDALRSFDKLRQGCFGKTLDSNYAKLIEKLQESLLQTCNYN